MKRKVNINRLVIFVICCWTLRITSAQPDLLRNSLNQAVPVAIQAHTVGSSGTPQIAGADTTDSTGTSSDKHRIRTITGHAFTFVPEPSTTVSLLGALLALVAFGIIRRRRLSVSRQ